MSVLLLLLLQEHRVSTGDTDEQLSLKDKQRRLTEPTEAPTTAHANITHSAVPDVVLSDLLPFTVYTDIDREPKMSEFSLRVGRRLNRCLVERLWGKNAQTNVYFLFLFKCIQSPPTPSCLISIFHISSFNLDPTNYCSLSSSLSNCSRVRASLLNPRPSSPRALIHAGECEA